MLLDLSRPAIPLLAPPGTAGPADPIIEKMVNLMPDYSAGRKLHALYVNKLQGILPGNYSQLFGTGPAFRGIFFPSWGADQLLSAVSRTGLDDGWWRGFSIALLCQAIRELASDIRGQMLIDKISVDLGSYNATLRSHSALAYSTVLENTYQPFVDLLRQVDRTKAKQQFHDSLLANVINRQLWYQAGVWTSPDWEMFNQYAKYLALGATTAEVDSLIGELMNAGLPVPDVVKPGAWLSYSEELRDKPSIDHTDIRDACAQGVTATTYMAAGESVARMPCGNSYEFTANSQPGNPYRRPPGGSCFTGYTQVLDGSGHPVELLQLRRGDTVLTRDGIGRVAYVGQPLRGERDLYRLDTGGPVFTATHPFLNAAEPVEGNPAPAFLAIDPGTLGWSVPTLSQDGIGKLEPGSLVLSRASGSGAAPVPVTVKDVSMVGPEPGDDHLYDVHLDPGDGGRQEYWAGRDGTFYLVSPEYPVISQAGPAAVTVVALMEGLLASDGPDGTGWPIWLADMVGRFGTGIFLGALTEALASTPSFGAPQPWEPLDARIERLYESLSGADQETAGVVASLFDGLLAALGQWLSSQVSLGWRTFTELGGDVLAVTVFDLALVPGNPLPADAVVRLDVTLNGRSTSESTGMWDLRGRPNTPFHRVFDQIVHVDLAAEDRLSNIAFAATIDGSSVPSICALAPTNVSESTHTFRSALLRGASGDAVGEIRFDARRLGQAAASQELANSGLWTDETAAAYANALGGAMVWPVLSQLQALSPVPA